MIATGKAHPGKRDELLNVILTHATNVERDEAEALSFLILESAEDEETVVIFERYTSETYFQKTHMRSESMRE